MARTFLAIVSLTVAVALLAVSTTAEASHPDRFLIHGRSLRLEDNEGIRKGHKCNATVNNVCPGILVKGGTQLLQCCKRRCRNVLSDRNHCGVCREKCRFGQLCCGGRCTAVADDVDNCGKCGKKCAAGVRCAFGVCGYA
ncbi:unnamed protein product [Spirodela intermedia]|uniref:Uncharacterized protein n=1 Tax=Spirodela intermedia TaxID=51605 RepID=A0A7I8LK90_SPIIN|nr:unnamed protein product [Spirodela intermedia]